jgi:hypothetical protein
MEYCHGCLRHGARTPVEKYRDLPLECCTYHYWLTRGRAEPGRFTLEAYVKSSESHAFTVSLPPEKDRPMMRESDCA